MRQVRVAPYHIQLRDNRKRLDSVRLCSQPKPPSRQSRAQKQPCRASQRRASSGWRRSAPVFGAGPFMQVPHLAQPQLPEHLSPSWQTGASRRRERSS